MPFQYGGCISQLARLSSPPQDSPPDVADLLANSCFLPHHILRLPRKTLIWMQCRSYFLFLLKLLSHFAQSFPPEMPKNPAQCWPWRRSCCSVGQLTAPDSSRKFIILTEENRIEEHYCIPHTPKSCRSLLYITQTPVLQSHSSWNQRSLHKTLAGKLQTSFPHSLIEATAWLM